MRFLEVPLSSLHEAFPLRWVVSLWIPFAQFSASKNKALQRFSAKICSRYQAACGEGAAPARTSGP